MWNASIVKPSSHRMETEMRQPSLGQLLVIYTTHVRVVEVTDSGFYSLDESTGNLYWSRALGFRAIAVSSIA